MTPPPHFQELRRDVTELRRALHQSKVESEFLREELRKAAGQSATPEHFMEENIKLSKEVRVCDQMLLCVCVRFYLFPFIKFFHLIPRWRD